MLPGTIHLYLLSWKLLHSILFHQQNLRSQAEPDYIDEILNFADEKELSGEASSSADKDELYQAALDIIRSEGKASTSFLQRKLQIGYNRAARIVDMMEADGVVSKANHVGKRDVL